MARGRASFRSWVSGCGIALGLLAASAPGNANGRFPAANHLVVQPGAPETMVLRATFGFLVTHDAGATWHWVCERAIGFSGVQDPAVQLTAHGALLAALFEGLAVAPHGGCDFAFASGALANQVAVDLTAWPGVPGGAAVVTGSYAGSVDGGARYRSQIFVTRDDGASFEAIGAALDPQLVVETFDVSPADPKRVYVSALRGESAKATGVLLVSSDGGLTWVERPVPLEEGERAPYIAGVDPARRDRVYLRTSGPGTQRLIVTDDAGKTLKTVHRGQRLLGFALSKDGSRVFLGGPREGLLVADRDTMAFTKRASLEVQCLTVDGDKLFACSNEASGFLVGVSTDEGASFRPLLRFAEIRGILPCAGVDKPRVEACRNEWPVLRQELAIPERDANGNVVVKAAAADAGSSSKPAARACGCDVVGAKSTEGEPPFVTALALSVLALAIRPRTRPSREAR
jgi:hypothetical protein